MLSLVNLSKTFGNKVLFQNLTHSLPAGKRIGLVGPNGAGKTSLLNIICGLDHSDSKGQIVAPKGTKIGYLPQEINPTPLSSVLEECLSGHRELYPILLDREKVLEEMAANYSEAVHERYEKIEHIFQQLDGYSLEGEAHKLLLGLGFKEQDLTRNPKEFSGGWRMRLELAKVLLNEPDILILDEPTNHLDLPSLMFLEEFLLSFKGTLLFVSHDQELLDRLANIILYLRNGKISEYSGNFSDFLERHNLEKFQAESQKKSLDKQIQHNQKFVDRFGAKATKAKQANSRKKLISRLQVIQGSIETEDARAYPHIAMPVTKSSARVVLKIEQASFGYDKPLVRGLNLQVQRGQKIAIVGANGIGKSTLLKTLVGEVPLLSGSFTWGEHVSIGYYAQSQVDQLNMKQSAFDNVLAANGNLAEHQVRKILGSLLFKENDVHKPVSVMSGGEKSRVGLACLIAQQANVLLMDEPTNHLDMIAMEKLADALCDYTGTLLFVSHDRRFINRVASHILGINAQGKYLLVEGTWPDFLEKSAHWLD